jgi:hypothetical protein
MKAIKSFETSVRSPIGQDLLTLAKFTSKEETRYHMSAAYADTVTEEMITKTPHCGKWLEIGQRYLVATDGRRLMALKVGDLLAA